MKIEVWSDYVCPFCYIGKRRLEEALASFPHRDKVEVEFKSFELDPHANYPKDASIHEILGKKYGTTFEEGKKMNDNMARQAETVGLTFNFDTAIPANTFLAHRFAKFAEIKGKAPELTERLLLAYFTESKDINDINTLVELAEEVGLNRLETEKMLQSSDFEQDVRADEEEARAIGVQGVPFFVLNRKYAISGAQPTEVFVGALEKVWEEENPKPTFTSLNGNEGAVCTDEGCEPPK